MIFLNLGPKGIDFLSYLVSCDTVCLRHRNNRHQITGTKNEIADLSQSDFDALMHSLADSVEEALV